jgi:arginyl-tRNA--protein-N-Asp/Glu arginylyltransferase
MTNVKAPVEFYRPRSLSPKRLDAFLAAGWFRSGNGLFRNKMLCFGGRLCTVVNIRLRTEKISSGKRIRKIRRKNSGFRVEVGPLLICRQMEELYVQTKSRFKGFVFPDIRSFLHDSGEAAVFSSHHVKVYDGDKLIACSVFDTGQQSLMSVIGLYDPAYKAFSPGIFTMLCETDHAVRQGFRFYYPGYIIHEAPEFNYKLCLGKYEYLNHRQRWCGDYDSVIRESPVRHILEASSDLEKSLQKKNIPYEKKLYMFFSLGYAYPFSGIFREPLVFFLKHGSTAPGRICSVAFNYLENNYSLRYLTAQPDAFLSGNQSDEFRDPQVYYHHILFETTDFICFDRAEELEQLL